MGFLGRWPDGFVPEDYGWLLANTAEGIRVWLRWEPPFKFPASIAECLHDPASGAVGGWYMPSSAPCPETMTQGEVHQEMRARETGRLAALEREALKRVGWNGSLADSTEAHE